MSRVKHLFAVVLAALMLCLLMPVAAFAEEAIRWKNDSSTQKLPV